MQVAKLFASLGFKVDLTAYNVFEQKLKDVRKETRNYAVSLKTIRTRLNHVSVALDGVNKKLDASKVKASNQRIASSANRLANAVERSAKGLNSVITSGHRVHTVISQINTILGRGINGWNRYNDQLRNAMRSLSAINASVRALPTHRTITITTRNTGNPFGGAGGHGGGAGGAGGAGGGAAGAAGAGFLGAGFRDFFRSMTPATAIAGGLVTAGFATKEIVQQGREMKKMEIIMTSATDGVDHFTESMKYVRGEANRLGQDVYEMGMGFAKMQQATRDKLNWNDRKTLFTGMAELSTTYGLNGDDQKGIWRALTQMFTKGKIEAEEEGQMAERGLPAKEMIKLATKRTFESQGKEFNDAIYGKMRQKGELKMQDIAAELGKIASEIAAKNGALDAALQTSLVGQMRLKNAFREASKQIMDAGLDKALFAIFELLKDLIPMLKSMTLTLVHGIRGWIELTKNIRQFISDHPVLSAVIAALIVAMRLLRFGIWGVASASLLMAGSFKKAMMIMWAAARRFLPIVLLYGLFKFGEEYNNYLKGEDNWITTFTLLFEVMSLKIQIYAKRIKLSIMEMNNMTKSTTTGWVTPSVPFSRIFMGTMQMADNMFGSNYDIGKTANRSIDRQIAPNPNKTLVNQNDIYLDGAILTRQRNTTEIDFNGFKNA